MRPGKTTYLVLLLLLISYFQLKGQDFRSSFFTEANRFFVRYAFEGRVDYTSLRQNPRDLNNLLNLVNLSDLSNAGNDLTAAYWINVYNLIVISQVTKYYPVNSVNDIPGFFDKNKFRIGNEMLTLNEIEEKKLRGNLISPRLSFLLCKGMVGSPPLRNESYIAETFSTQLYDQLTAVVNDSNFIRLRNDSVQVSSFFIEQRQEIVAVWGSLQLFINKYRKTPVGNDSLMTFFAMDQRLNDERRPFSNLHSDRQEPQEDLYKRYGMPELGSEADDGRLSELIIIPYKRFELRVNNNISGYKDFYNKKLARASSRFSYATDILTVQLFYGIGRKTSAGLAVSGRTSRLGSHEDNPSEIFDLKTDTNSAFYVRTISPILRFDIAHGFFFVRMQTFFNFPVTRIKPLKYNNVKVADENPPMLISQLYVYHYFSEYVKSGIEFDLSCKFDMHYKTITFSPRPLANTVFSMPLNKTFRLYGLIEFAPSANTADYFESYYFKEGLGLKTTIGKDEYTIYYSYMFLGKGVSAFNALVLNLRIGI